MNRSTRRKLEKVFNRLYTFSKFTYGRRFIDGAHLKRLSAKLELVATGKSKRLIVNMPPRHSKTTFCSINFPVWKIFKDPNLSILIVTYGDELSEEIGTEIRRIIKEYGHLFNVYLSPHTASKTKIKFVDKNGKDYRGKIQALGYKGAITGKDADIVIIDDLIKNAEEALSPKQNKKIVEFYKTAIYTRLFEHSSVIIVSTRWAKTDLVGWLIENSVEDWDKLILPAVDEDGKPLWPERFSKERMAIVEEEQGPFWWAALYLQDPEDLKGDVFEGEFLSIPAKLIDLNDFKRFVRFWDRASTDKQDSNDPDWTAGLLMGELKSDAKIKKVEDKKNDYSKLTHIVLDVVRFQGSPAKNQTKIRTTAEKDRSTYGGVEIFMEEEGGSSGKDTIDTYKREVLAGFKFKGIRSTGSKRTRAIDVAAAVEFQKVGFKKARWLGNLFLEMRAFPHGAHDDQVDTLSGSYGRFKKKTVLKARKRRRK